MVQVKLKNLWKTNTNNLEIKKKKKRTQITEERKKSLGRKRDVMIW